MTNYFVLTVIFPFLDILVSVFVLSQTIRHYKIFGYLPLYLTIGAGCSVWIGISCLLALLGVVNGYWFFSMIQGPFLVLLASPGLLIYNTIKQRLEK